MTTDIQTRKVVSAFLAARTEGDLEAAATHLASTFSFQTPLLQLDDPALYLASHRAAQSVVSGHDLISELYGSGEATMLYDLHLNAPSLTQRTAEHFKLVEDKIASILLIFDASPWRSR